MKTDKGSIVRTLMLSIALINQVFGVGTIALSEDQVITIVEGMYLLGSTLFTVATSIWAWWKNNYLSRKGKAQKEVLKREGLTE